MGKELLDTPCHCQQGPIAILALGSYSYWIVRGGVGRIIIHVGYVCVCFVKEVDVCEMILSLSSFGKRVLLLECVSAFFGGEFEFPVLHQAAKRRCSVKRQRSSPPCLHVVGELTVHFKV